MQNSQGWWSRNTVQTFSFVLEVGRKGNQFVLSAVFWGAMLVFSLLRRRSDVYVWPKKSLYTRILWGALLPWLEAEPWENNSRRRVTADDNYNINIWEWERHPGKKVKAVCSQEQLRGGCPLWDSQADRENRLHTTLQSSAEKIQLIKDLIQVVRSSLTNSTSRILKWKWLPLRLNGRFIGVASTCSQFISNDLSWGAHVV